MANHCIEGVCAKCGYAWCLRGCSWTAKYTEEELKKALEEHTVKFTDEKCPECGHKEIRVL